MKGMIRCVAAILSSLACAGMASVATAADATARIEAEFHGGYELVLEFPQPMQTWQNERRSDVVTLQPALPVQCAWGSDTLLSCEFEGEARPAAATLYRIAVAAGLKTQSGATLPARTLHAETGRPTLGANVEAWKLGLPEIVVSSNAKTTAASIAKVLRLRIDDESVALPPLRPLEPRGPWDTDRRFAMQLPTGERHDRRLVLAVVPGLKSGEGPLPGTQDAVLLTAQINERFRLRGVACAGPARAVDATPVDGTVTIDCMPGETVQIVFSRPLDAASREAFASALPEAVKLRGWHAGEDWRWRHRARNAIARAPSYRAELQVDAADAATELALPATLRAEGDGADLEPATIRIRTVDYRPMLHAPRAAALVADGERPPVLADAINAETATDIAVLSVGARARNEELRVPESARRNEAVAIASATTAQALAEGGWARWAPQPENGDAESFGRMRSAVQFAAPEFDLFAVAGRREVLAWANAWEGDRAVAGAEVELLWLETADAAPKIMARATTGEDGVARLRLPQDFVAPVAEGQAAFPMWLLRAADGRGRRADRAVLPVGVPTRYGMSLGRGAETRLWGVADRPLYRAGDTVRYRLWQRQASGGRLLRIGKPQPITLKLYNQDENKVIREWQSMPTAGGAIAGDLVLPVHLTDASYCIGAGEDYSIEGTCFFVGTYRAQDLWAEAKAEDRVLRDGDRFAVDLQAGYYSGGPAAGVAISQVTTMLTGLPLQEAYPQYDDYTFVDVLGDDASSGIPLAGEESLKPVADADGKARIELPVRFDSLDAEREPTHPAFGRLQLVAEVKLADREATASNAAKARYTRHERFVGLRLQPRWLDAATPAEVEAVVIAADGNAIADAQVEVEVHYLPGFGGDRDKEQAQLLTRCRIAAKAMTACDFPRKRSGRYRLTARSGEAAPAEIIRYVWRDGVDDGLRGNARSTELELLEAPAAAGAPVRVLLKQPKPSARVLFVFGSEDAILGHRVERIAGNARDYALPIVADGRREVAVTAYVRDAAVAMPGADGYRIPVEVTSARLQVPLPDDIEARKPLALAFDVASAKPGDTVRISLRNDGRAPREVVLAVMDDALRALADDFLPYFDPQGEHWLGARTGYGRAGTTIASFGSWNRDALRMALPWPLPVSAREVRNVSSCAQGDAAEQAACAAMDAARAAADAAAAAGNDGAPVAVDFDAAVAEREVSAGAMRAGVPPPLEEPAVVFDEPGAVDMPRQVMLAMPAPMADIGGSTQLDRIEVTGSRIKRVDTFSEGAAPRRGLRPREDARAAEERRSLRTLARVRTQFADTALWQPDIRLAPGESRTIELKLPDNLTRWRALAWSSDADDGFDMAQATLDTGLPVEVRLQTPVRIYPGDRSRLAANVRQTGDAAVDAQAELRVDGIGAPQAHAQRLPLGARGQGSFALEIAPQDTGSLLAAAVVEIPTGRDPAARDAVAAPIDVASPLIAARKVQAGWLDAEALALDLPELPAGASDAHLHVGLLRGAAGLVERWTHDLRDYPHRCWEQILSRAVAAALAIERGDTDDWPRAQTVVQEALDNAAVFQGQAGDFRYFAEEPRFHEYAPEPQPQIALTAYTVRAFALLRELGHPVAPQVDARAREFLRNADGIDDEEPDAGDLIAFAASATGRLSVESADALWKSWDKLSLPAQIAATRALAAVGHVSRDDAMHRLLQSAPARGATRALRSSQRDDDRWMGSDLREQCALIELLRDYPQLADADARRSLVAGLSDLYAGGIEAVDTQTGAYCLIALRDLARAQAYESPSAVLHLGGTRTELRLAAGEGRADWQAPLTEDTTTLRIEPGTRAAVPSSYVAELRYQEDARQARASAVGFSIERRYEVLRAGGWMPIARAAVREGDWLRVTLVVQTVASRHFVAVTDAVPGGLRPTDLALSSVAGLDLAKVSEEGSYWFGTRRLDPRSPRFYAEFLPAGRHELHYFARAGNAGDYLAAPALAELMYGNASNARTAATRLVVAPADVAR
jgi:uncharacterized protein YfaS (alpha-2-macroglobulin family)